MFFILSRHLGLANSETRARATFAIASNDLKEEAEREIRVQYEKAIQILESQNRYLIDRIFDLSMHALQQPRKQISAGGDYIEAYGDVQINKITITQAIEEIKNSVDKEPGKSFKGKSKKKILEILDDTLKDVAKGGLEEAGKRIFELARTDLAPLIPKIATQLGILKMTGAL